MNFTSILDAENKLEVAEQNIKYYEKSIASEEEFIEKAREYIKNNSLTLFDIRSGAVFEKNYGNGQSGLIIVVETGYQTGSFYFCGREGLPGNPLASFSDRVMSKSEAFEKIKNMSYKKSNLTLKLVKDEDSI